MESLFKQKWFVEGFNAYEPDKKVIKNISKHLKKHSIEIHLSLYCKDVRALMPIFFKVLNTSGFKDYKINYIKKGGLPYITNRNEIIIKIPTIIFYEKTGRMKGKIIESIMIMPTIEREVLQIINY